MSDAPQELYPLILDSITEGVFTAGTAARRLEHWASVAAPSGDG